MALSKSDFDFDISCVHISKTVTFLKKEHIVGDVKTFSSNRTLLLSETVVSFLNEYLNVVDDYLFLNKMTGSSLTYHFKQILKSCGLPLIRLHDLRHTYATLLLLKNIPVKVVSARLGHSSTSVTNDIYSHVLIDMQQPAVNAIDFLLC